MTTELLFMRAYIDQRAGGDQDADDPEKPIRFVASTEGVKGDGFDLRADDWDLSRFRKHPVILYAHDYLGQHLPLGTGRASLEDGTLFIDVRFDPNDPFAQQVRQKTRAGMMGGSVGWQSTPKGKNQLLEFSIVPIPLDPDALPVRQQRTFAIVNRLIDKLLQGDGSQPPDGNGDGDGGADDPDTRSADDPLTRAGAILSARNMADLEEAARLLTAVIERAKKDQVKSFEGDEGGRSIDDPQADDADPSDKPQDDGGLADWIERFAPTLGNIRSTLDKFGSQVP